MMKSLRPTNAQSLSPMNVTLYSKLRFLTAICTPVSSGNSDGPRLAADGFSVGTWRGVGKVFTISIPAIVPRRQRVVGVRRDSWSGWGHRIRHNSFGVHCYWTQKEFVVSTDHEVGPALESCGCDWGDLLIQSWRRLSERIGSRRAHRPSTRRMGNPAMCAKKKVSRCSSADFSERMCPYRATPE
jgi:hypothetical protein